MIAEPAADAKKTDEKALPSLAEIIRDIAIDDISNEAVNLAKRYGYLPYMVQRYIDMLKYEEARKLIEAFENYDFRPVVLCNKLKVHCFELAERLAKLGFELKPISWCDYAYMVTQKALKPSLGSTHEYLKGLYYIYRDGASLLPVIVLSPEPGSKVLDVCAAPGGKSIHILMKLKDSGILVANDISIKRLKALMVNLFRMGFKSYAVIAEDGTKLPGLINLRFDYVLLDAPCSAEGAIMFDRSRKTKTSINTLAKLVLREIRLLISAIKMARSGGRVVYTTCSIAPEENEYVVTKALELADESIEIEEVRGVVGDNGLTKFKDLKFNPKVSRCIRIWPHKHSMEGYFICSLRKL